MWAEQSSVWGSIGQNIGLLVKHPSRNIHPTPFPDNKTPTLAADDVHFQGRMIEPGLDVEPEEARRDGVLEVGDLHRVRVLVAAQKLKTWYKYQTWDRFRCLICLELQKLQIAVSQRVIRIILAPFWQPGV